MIGILQATLTGLSVEHPFRHLNMLRVFYLQHLETRRRPRPSMAVAGCGCTERRVDLNDTAVSSTSAVSVRRKPAAKRLGAGHELARHVAHHGGGITTTSTARRVPGEAGGVASIAMIRKRPAYSGVHVVSAATRPFPDRSATPGIRTAWALRQEFGGSGNREKIM